MPITCPSELAGRDRGPVHALSAAVMSRWNLAVMDTFVHLSSNEMCFLGKYKLGHQHEAATGGINSSRRALGLHEACPARTKSGV